MGPELDVKGNIDAVVEVSEINENKKVTQSPDDMLLKCANKIENKIFDPEFFSTEQTFVPDQHEDAEINITEFKDNCDGGLVERECQDATENSSSFADTFSGTENENGLLLNDEEVESQLCDDNLLEPVYDGYCGEFQMRQKKLTLHWRKFIRPIMWRCKWTELQIRELKSKALKYDRELASNNASHMLEVTDAKSSPLPSQRHRNKILKRAKRKRIEQTLDTASYMLHHNLFSYYEKKKSDSAAVEDFGGNLDKKSIRNDECRTAEECSSFNLRDGENSLEDILSRIEVMHTEVQKLKSRVDKVVNENPIKLSFIAPTDIPNSPVENRFPDSSQHISEYLGDMLKTEGAVSSRVDIPRFSDLIEGADKSRVSGSSENAEDDILIHNQTAKDELRDFENVRGQFTNQPQPQPRVLPEDRKPDLPMIVESIATPNHQSFPPTKTTFDRNKRKRQRRR